MKRLDLTKTGGYPFTQDDLDYMQTGYREAFIGMAKAADDGSTPFSFSGCVVTGTTTLSITAGWFYYNGDLHRMPAQSVTPPGGQSVYVQILTNSTPLTFDDGSAPNVVIETVGKLMGQTTGTANDSTHFLLTDMVTYQQQLGVMGRESAYSTLAVSTSTLDGGVIGDLLYKKNRLTNQLYIRTTIPPLTVGYPDNLPSSLTWVSKDLGTLPVGYRPSGVVWFVAATVVVDGGFNRLADDTSVGYIDQTNFSIDSYGVISAQMKKPAAGCTGYYFEFNVVIPLD